MIGVIVRKILLSGFIKKQRKKQSIHFYIVSKFIYKYSYPEGGQAEERRGGGASGGARRGETEKEVLCQVQRQYSL